VPASNSILNDDKALNKMDAIVNLLRIVYEPFEDYDLILKDMGEILYEPEHIYLIVEMLLGILMLEYE